MAVIVGLNKVMGRSSKIEAPLGVVTSFENLEIIARKCIKAAGESENTALLEIREIRPDEEQKQVFLGWMFSISPSVSAMEHPVYDVTLLNCEYKNLEN